MPDGLLHVICSRQGWQNCAKFVQSTGVYPSEVLLFGCTCLIPLLSDDSALLLHDLAGSGMVVTVILSDLTMLDLDIGDLPGYITAVESLETALQIAARQRLNITHWP